MIEDQIFYSKLKFICREMSENLQRTSRSPLLARDHAFATGLMTGDIELAVQVQHEPDHLYALSESSQSLFDYFSYDISQGDVLITADPYRGGTQSQTITMAAPSFLEGELILFPVVRAQMTDLAGEYPGGYNPDAFEVWQESVRISPIKLYKSGVLQRDVWRFLMNNSRIPRLLASDLHAMYACCQTAQNKIQSLLKSNRPHKIKESLANTFDYSKRRLIQYLKNIPEYPIRGASGVYKEDGTHWPINVTLRRESERVHVDFAGTHEQVNGPYNSPLTATKAFAVWPILASFVDEIPINQGVLDTFRVKAPSGSLVHPEFPSATAFSGKITGHFIASAVTSALKSSGKLGEMFPTLHGPGPQAVLFEPIGSMAEMEPLFFVPGFPLANEGWGPSGLSGDRQLISAEEIEMYYGFRMIKRERGEQDGSGMTVQLVNHRGPLQANFIIPHEKSNRYGFIETGNHSGKKFYKPLPSIPLELGDLITFYYPGKGVKSDD